MPLALDSPLRGASSALPIRQTLDDCTHVWKLSVLAFAFLEKTLASFLSSTELAKADAFCSPRDRLRYVVTRGCLRLLSARYSGANPASIPIRNTGNGKPIARTPGSPHFSVSHSNDFALLAFSAHPVGVDVEHIRPIPDLLRVASLVFSPAELEPLTRLTGAARELAFFTSWTRLEARLKASGDGLSAAASRGPTPAAGTCLSTLSPPSPSSQLSSPRSTHDIPLPTPLIAALVTRNTRFRLFALTPHFLEFAQRHANPNRLSCV